VGEKFRSPRGGFAQMLAQERRSLNTPSADVLDLRNASCSSIGRMAVASQQAIVDFLMSPDTHGGAPVERVDTHISIVFLAGSRALKLKRAVRFDYVDFSTPELRHAACAAELRINRRAAPSIYRRIAAVTREADGTLALDGAGAPIEWLVEMRRFDQELLLDRLAARGTLDLGLMRPLASAIAQFHAGVDRRADHGGHAGMAWVIDGNAQGFAEQGKGILDPDHCARLSGLARSELTRHSRLLDTRRVSGFVRQCHGDLHLRNLVLLDGRPTLFDAIEFNDEIACVDVLYDLAFLLMDLWRRQLPAHANVVFNRYLAETGDFAGLPLLPLFLSCRAAIRAKTGATAARVQNDPGRRRELEDAAREYLLMAEALLQPAPPRLIAIGGSSGSGKSTLALALAPSIGHVPGALVLRSDEIRKRLCGASEFARLGPGGYAADVSRRVYRTLTEHAQTALAAGYSVIADAVFARPSDRAAIEAAALSTGVPFHGIWLDAPAAVLTERVGAREPDTSDADAAVVRQQLAAGVGQLSWRRIDATGPPASVLARVQALLSDRVHAGASVQAVGGSR
jgi:aminoglycoside phosphotransferase family enzyme/predicted kinase